MAESCESPILKVHDYNSAIFQSALLQSIARVDKQLQSKISLKICRLLKELPERKCGNPITKPTFCKTAAKMLPSI
jgi:hypothetical protein